MAKHTTMRDAPNAPSVTYMHGGNPPIAAGLFNRDGVRLAWWPAAIEPTDEHLEKVVEQLVWKRERDDVVITRKQILDLLWPAEVVLEPPEEGSLSHLNRRIAGDR